MADAEMVPRLFHCSWVVAYYLPEKMTEWTPNRTFHGVQIYSDPPHSAGSQEQVYGSAAPVVLDFAIHDQFLVSFTETNRFF